MKKAVFTSFDEHYAEYALVMVRTFCENYHGDNINLYCLVPESLKPLQQSYRDSCINYKNVGIYFVTASRQKEIYDRLTDEHIEISYITKECFHRIFIADEFPELDEAIYIDPDTIILRNIQGLIDQTLPLAIAAKSEIATSKMSEPGNQDIVYFNNGVYKTNLNFWRENDLASKMISHIDANGISIYPEQDLMNMFFVNQTTELSINFNYFSWFDKVDFFRDNFAYPAIVHFSGPDKPWKNHSSEQKWSSLWRSKYKEIYGLDISETDDYLNLYEYTKLTTEKS